MKRKLSILLVLAMLVSMFSVPVMGAGTTFTDVTEETSYRPAIINLNKIGLINGEKLDDGTYVFRPDSSITRAEFTAILVRALGAGDIVATADQFSDVAGHWAEGNISVASSRGIILGFEDGTFRPDEPVTYEQAMKMVVCTLGYENNAISAGGWPNGYMSVGADLSLNKEIKNVNQADPAPRGVIAQLIYNALDVDVMEIKIAGQDTGDTKTFMQKYLNLERSKGIIAAVETDVTAMHPDTVGQKQLAAVINGETVYMDFSQYSDNKADVTRYLGQTVNLFYKTDVVGSDDMLIDIDAETTKNTVTTINYEQLYTCDGDTIQYYDTNDKLKKLTVNDATSIIYNGVLLTKGEANLEGWLTEGDEDFIYGEVVATDSGDTGVISILEITDYEIIIASKSVSATDYKITNKLKFEDKKYAQLDSAILDPNDVKYEFTITYNGSSIEPTAIKQNDVVLYAESADAAGEKRKALVSRNPVSGTVTAYSVDDQTITVSGKTYDIHDICLQYLKENSMEFKVSASVKLYLDAFNVVVFAEITSSQTESPFAYIINAGNSEDDDSRFITMYVPASKSYKRYILKERVNYNGASITDSQVVSNLREQSNKEVDGVAINFEDDIDRNTNLSESPYEDETSQNVITPSSEVSAVQMARVTVSGNYVTHIVTTSYKIGETVEDTSILSKYSNLEKIKYVGSKSFNSKFYYDSKTIVLYVPQDRTDTTEYSVKTASSYFTSSKEYWVEAYNVNKSKVAGLIIVYGSAASGSGITHTTPISILGERMSDEEVDGEVKLKMPFYRGADEFVSEYASSASEFEDVVIGDVIQFGYDSSDEAKGLKTRIAMADIQEVLSDAAELIASGSSGEIYDWNPGDKVSDIRKGSYADNSKYPFFYQTGEMHTTEYSFARAFMANVLEVDDEEGMIRVTIDGFNWDGTEYTLADGAIEERIEIDENTHFVRYDAENDEITPYAANTEALLSMSDLADARYSGVECSKILVHTTPGSKCKFICIYE